MIRKGIVPRDSIFSPQRNGPRGSSSSSSSSSSRHHLGRRRDGHQRAIGGRVVRWNDGIDAMMNLLVEEGENDPRRRRRRERKTVETIDSRDGVM